MADNGTGAQEYHEETKHSPQSVRNSSHSLNFDNKPIPFKIYEDTPKQSLAREIRPSQIPALRAIADRTESDGVVVPSLEDITQLCYYSSGITKKIRRGQREILFRAASCTGALYHIDLYLVCGNLEGLDPGVYHFDPKTLSLDVLREGDYRGVLAEASGNEESVRKAPITFVATSTWWRNSWKYRERTYRHSFWDSGTVLANFLAVANSLDL
ncbi:MAG: SagB/ThcOx family dehydrogenase, partial [Halobacteria archaeon]|nr:SagB/ThcOx family dehydrogenase [Halobacteria archaeon]